MGKRKRGVKQQTVTAQVSKAEGERENVKTSPAKSQELTCADRISGNSTSGCNVLVRCANLASCNHSARERMTKSESITGIVLPAQVRAEAVPPEQLVIYWFAGHD